MYNLKGFACRSDKSTESYQQILASCLDSTAHNFTVLFQSHSSHQVKGKKNRKTLNWRQKKMEENLRKSHKGGIQSCNRCCVY